MKVLNRITVGHTLAFLACVGLLGLGFTIGVVATILTVLPWLAVLYVRRTAKSLRVDTPQAIGAAALLIVVACVLLIGPELQPQLADRAWRKCVVAYFPALLGCAIMTASLEKASRDEGGAS